MNKVSVIIPTYNRPASLKIAIQSILDQGIDDLEIIIIDDYSEEKHWPEIKGLAGLDNISLIRNDQNLGVAASRNKGLEQASGTFVLFLDDDDVLLANMLRESLDAIQKDNLDLVSCRSVVAGEGLSAKKLKRYNRQQTQRLSVYPMETQPVAHIFLYAPQIHTFLVRRAAIGENQFPIGLTYGEDMVFWLALAKKGLKCRKLNFVGCCYYIHDRSVSEQIDFESKILFYTDLLTKTKGCRVIQNLCHIKIAYLNLTHGKIEGLKWMMKAVTKPRLYLRHIRYYI